MLHNCALVMLCCSWCFFLLGTYMGEIKMTDMKDFLVVFLVILHASFLAFFFVGGALFFLGHSDMLHIIGCYMVLGSMTWPVVVGWGIIVTTAFWPKRILLCIFLILAFSLLIGWIDLWAILHPYSLIPKG